MTEYTPTTEIVRSGYYYSEVVDASGPTDDGEIYAGFDRWLAEHDRQTAEAAYNEGARTGWMNGSGTLADAYKHNPYRKDTHA